jgi:hypothetical protein
MDPDQRADEESDSHTAAQQSEEANPAASQPESPRLGIIHLLGWTACVAAYFGTRRWLALLSGLEPAATPRSWPWFLEGCLWGFCNATALGGPVLLAARRLRRLPFPQYPGETWFVILGLMVVIDKMRRPLAVFMPIPFSTSIPGYYVYLYLVRDALVALLFLVGTIRTKSLRWRLCFGSYLATLALLVIRDAMIGLTSFDRVLDGRAPLMMAAIGSVCLIGAAVKDFVDRHRTGYPWTHWTGVALALPKLTVLVRYLIFEPLVPWLVSVYVWLCPRFLL